MNTDIALIHEKIKPLVGQKPWEVKLGWGSFITFEFGEKLPDEGGHIHGEWHLWVRHCAWRIETEDMVLAASQDNRDNLAVAVKVMKNASVLSIEVLAPALETIIQFEDSLYLRLFPMHTEKFDSWQLFTPDRNVLTICPGSQWSYQSADEPRK
jgi:hypothetical protein